MLPPSQAHDKQRTQTLDIVTTGDHKILKFWDYISESGMQGLEDTHATSLALLTTHSPVVTDHSLRFYQDLAREYVPLGEHTQLRAVKDAECIVLHQETKGVEVEFDDGLVVLQLAINPSHKLVTRLHRARWQVKIATSGQKLADDRHRYRYRCRCLKATSATRVNRPLRTTISKNLVDLELFLQSPRYRKRKKRLDRGSNPGHPQFMKGALTTELRSGFVEASPTHEVQPA